MKTALSMLVVLLATSAVAALEPSRIREALPKKTENYLGDGVITGGDREVRGGIVKDLRRAANAGFERIVLDLESEKPPYFQAAVEPAEKRIVVTVFGNPHIGLNAKKIVENFKKSPLVQSVEFFPKVEEDTFIFALHLRAAVPVEVFELSAPSRIILDLKASPKFVTEVSPITKTAPKMKATAKAVKRPKTLPLKQANPVLEDDVPTEGNGASSHSEEIPE